MGELENDPRVDVAFELVEEALRPLDHLLSPELRLAIRAVMVAELLDTPEGQRTLRSVMPDPIVEQSGSVAKDGAASDGESQAGQGKTGAGKTGTR